MPRTDEPTGRAAVVATGLPQGVPVALLAGLALVATAFGRLLSPALFGSATGLDRWIMAAQALGNVSSQAVAAGGVAFALRAVGVTLSRGGLGIAFRMVVIPAAVATSALAMIATGRVLEPQLGSALAVTSLVSAAGGAPIALYFPASRGLGIVLALTALSGAIDFAGLSLASAAVENGSATGYTVAGGFMTVGFVLELLLIAVAAGFVTGGSRRRGLILAVVSTLLSLALVVTMRSAFRLGASTAEVVVARAASALLHGPPPFVPPAARLVLEVGSLVAAAGGIFAARRSPFAPLMALCLTARGAPDVPIPALLLVVAGIAVPAYAMPANSR